MQQNMKKGRKYNNRCQLHQQQTGVRLGTTNASNTLKFLATTKVIVAEATTTWFHIKKQTKAKKHYTD